MDFGLECNTMSHSESTMACMFILKLWKWWIVDLRSNSSLKHFSLISRMLQGERRPLLCVPSRAWSNCPARESKGICPCYMTYNAYDLAAGAIILAGWVLLPWLNLNGASSNNWISYISSRLCSLKTNCALKQMVLDHDGGLVAMASWQQHVSVHVRMVCMIWYYDCDVGFVGLSWRFNWCIGRVTEGQFILACSRNLPYII